MKFENCTVEFYPSRWKVDIKITDKDGEHYLVADTGVDPGNSLFFGDPADLEDV